MSSALMPTFCGQDIFIDAEPSDQSITIRSVTVLVHRRKLKVMIFTTSLECLLVMSQRFSLPIIPDIEACSWKK